MVRPEGEGSSGRRPRGPEPSCANPAGASPVPVSAGAPGSRPQARTERDVSRAGHQEPLRRERVRGPQREVNPAASSDEQCGSRAAHLTAKATPAAQRTGAESARGSTGVWGAAREQGSERNRRGPSARSLSRQGVPYKPRVSAACNDANQAGESPVAAIARFGCVAMPDDWRGRPCRPKAQAKVLAAAPAVGPDRRASKDGGRSEREHCSVESLSHENQDVGPRAAEPLHFGRRPMGIGEVTGKCNRSLLRRMGGGTCQMGGDPKQGRSQGHRAGACKPMTARRTGPVRLADRVVVATMSLDNITRTERRARGQRRTSCSGSRPDMPSGQQGQTTSSTDGLRAQQTRTRGRLRLRQSPTRCLKPYWGKPAVRNFRGALGRRSHGAC
jgi:hypothetical protein